MIGPYQASKFLAEQVALGFAHQGLPVVVVNPSAPVGPWDVKPTPTGRMIVDFLEGRMFATLDTGLNLVHVRDVARGHLLAAERGKIGEKYILGNRNLSLVEIGVLLSEITGMRPPRVRIPYWVACVAALAMEGGAGAGTAGPAPGAPALARGGGALLRAGRGPRPPDRAQAPGRRTRLRDPARGARGDHRRRRDGPRPRRLRDGGGALPVLLPRRLCGRALLHRDLRLHRPPRAPVRDQAGPGTPAHDHHPRRRRRRPGRARVCAAGRPPGVRRHRRRSEGGSLHRAVRAPDDPPGGTPSAILPGRMGELSRGRRALARAGRDHGADLPRPARRDRDATVPCVR